MLKLQFHSLYLIIFISKGMGRTMETPLPMATGWRDHHNFGEATDTGETYDLVVVGGGLGGLTAAYFYNRETAEDKKILILDNHPDFGGDFQCNGLTVAGKN
jgi:spermidine dehydrogenase